jgi:predicted ATP-dependent endonuclease of OLD family
MDLKAFRIQLYKCIIDSGWIEINSLTALIGKNGAGKTSLLKALYKFYPSKNADSYSLEIEWPRSRRKERDQNQIVCSTRFALTEDELRDLSNLTGQTVTEKEIIITRDYMGNLYVNFPAGLFPDKHSPKELEDIFTTFPVFQDPVGTAFRQKALEYIEEARLFAFEGRFSEIVKMFSAKVTELRAVVNSEPTSDEGKNEEAFIFSYANQISIISRQLAETMTISEKAADFVIKHIPSFIYMSDYQVFSGCANLLQLKQRKEQNQLTDDDKTFLSILDLADLNLEKLVTTENPMDRDQRQYDLADASVNFTKIIASHWQQHYYEVQFHSDGQIFYTFVKDLGDSSLIHLEERSRGFQWFFSFDLMFLNESQGTFKNCVILLDEPGLHLHPSAQIDLIRRMEEYSKNNTLIYTTHLPMLLDLTRSENVRILSEKSAGTVVEQSISQCKPDEKIVLDAALKISTNLCCLPEANNIIVPKNTYRLLVELFHLWQRLENTEFIEDYFLIPAANNLEAIHFYALLVGQGINAAVLFSDKDGLDTIKGFEQNWILNSRPDSSKFLLLGECFEKDYAECFIEDCFPDEYYIAKITQIYQKQLALLGCNDLNIQGNGSIIQRTQNLLEQLGLQVNRDLINKAICSDIRKMQSTQELTESTHNMIQHLIENLQSFFDTNSHKNSSNGLS